MLEWEGYLQLEKAKEKEDMEAAIEDKKKMTGD